MICERISWRSGTQPVLLILQSMRRAEGGVALLSWRTYPPSLCNVSFSLSPCSTAVLYLYKTIQNRSCRLPYLLPDARHPSPDSDSLSIPCVCSNLPIGLSCWVARARAWQPRRKSERATVSVCVCVCVCVKLFAVYKRGSKLITVPT